MSQSAFERVAPRLAKAHRERAAEIRRRRPCGRDGWCCACWFAEQVRTGSRTRYEPTPWLYNFQDRRYAGKGAYTLLIHPGGLMQRVYDRELEHNDLALGDARAR